MDATTQFIVGLFLLLASAVIVGEAMSRLGQLALVGQLGVGLVFGPTLLGPALGLGNLASALQGIQFLATFFILMAAGLAVTPDQVRATGAASILLGTAIFAGPFVAGAAVLHLVYPSLPTMTALFASVTISITALPVLGVMLRELDLLGSRLGSYVLNGALVNELAAVTVFAVLLRLRAGGGAASVDVVTAIVAVGLFLTTVLAAHRLLRLVRASDAGQRWAVRFRRTWRSREVEFAILMVAALGAALYSQYLGLTFLIGAFYAGLLVTPESAGRRQHRAFTQVFDAITWGFFIPLFFALVGLGMNLREIGSSEASLLAFAALCAFAFVVKLAVGGAVTRSLGWPSADAWGAGFLVTSRGAVELAMAVILLSLGVFSTGLFTVVAGVALVTTFLAPIGARPFFRNLPRPRRSAPERAGDLPLVSWLPPPLPSAADEAAPD